MPSDLKAYRIFVASPGGLDEERKAFHDVIQRYNAQEANQRGVHFIPTGWESNPGGPGRPQRLINEQVEQSDFFVLLLWDRWGTPPAEPGTSEYKGYESGTEEEYAVACACLADVSMPMRDFMCSFRKCLNSRSVSSEQEN